MSDPNGDGVDDQFAPGLRQAFDAGLNAGRAGNSTLIAELTEARARLLRAYSALDMCLHADESLAELRTVQAVIRDRSSSPQPTATHFACPQRHIDSAREAESDD